MAIQEVPWFQAATDVQCLQCAALADTPNIHLLRKVRLNSARDGWVIVEFECPECGWKPPAITTQLDPPKVSAIIQPTAEEIVSVQEKPAARPQRIVMPERPPVDVEELFAHAEKHFPPKMKLKTGESLTRTVVKVSNQDAAGIKVLYTDGRGTVVDGVPNPYHIEKTLFCEPDLPDNQEFVDNLLLQIGANLKAKNPHPRRVVAKPTLNAGRSRLRSACTYPVDDFGHECGDTSGDCGHPGVLRNLSSPGGMRANTNILLAPDGSRVQTLQEKLDPGGISGL